MQIPLVLTVVGRDRPGLVESIARIIAARGGNWLESRMCRLGGEFAGILRIRVDSSEEKALQEELQALQAQGLGVTVCPARNEPERPAGQIVALELVGQDRPGIVRDISHALASQGVNVEDLVTECTSAPMSGETLFKAKALLQLPPSCPVAGLRNQLERVAGNLLVDVVLQEVK
ncbi:MAG: ACT domain-containing protein [Verrucomicrobiota bacterium]